MTKLYCPLCKEQIKVKLDDYPFLSPILRCDNCDHPGKAEFPKYYQGRTKGRPFFEWDCMTEDQYKKFQQDSLYSALQKQQNETHIIQEELKMSYVKGNNGVGNTGNNNIGDCNTGLKNKGYRNTGDCNRGCENTGNYNTGNYNTGNCNAGSRNTGSYNTGKRNNGNWNSGNYNAGHFCTTTTSFRMFNKDCTKEEFDCVKPSWLFFKLTEWIHFSDMTEQEKQDYPGPLTIGGFLLKVYEYKEAAKKAWAEASDEEKEATLKLPNFDADIFFEIFGINVLDQGDKHG